RRELRCKGALVPVEPQVFDLIVFLIRNRDRVVSKDNLIAGVWDGRIVSDSTLASRINAARRAIGDNGEQQRLIRTAARNGIRFVGVVREGQVPSELPAPVPAAVPNQEVTFCRTAEGINLALASIGGGAPLIKVANWLTHIEYDWESPIWSPLLQPGAALPADPLRRARQRLGRSRGDRHLVPGVRARPRNGGRRHGRGAIGASRHFARRGGRDCLCGAASGARLEADPLRWLRAGPQQARVGSRGR